MNIYRLIRVSVENLDALIKERPPGGYQAVLILLSVMHGAPEIAFRLFRRLWECEEKTLSELVSAMEIWADEDPGGRDINDKRFAKDLCYRLGKVKIDAQDLDIYRNWAEIVGRY